MPSDRGQHGVVLTCTTVLRGLDASIGESESAIDHPSSRRELVQRQERRTSIPYDVANHRIHQLDTLFIEIAVRLVEQKNPGASHDEPRQGQSTLHSRGKSANPVICHRRQSDALETRIGQLVGQSKHVGCELEILARSKILIQARRMGQVSNLAPYAARIAYDVESVHGCG